MTNHALRRLLATAALFAFTGWAAAQTTLAPTADAYVQNGLPAGFNFGTAKKLKAQTNATANKNFDSYLKFDTTSIPTFSAVKLRLYAALSGNGSVGTTLYTVSNTTWGETTITWNNKPALGVALASRAVTSKNFAWYEFDVTSYLTAERAAGRNVVTLALRAPTASSLTVNIKSRQATANKPKLVFTLNAAPLVSLTSPTNGASYAVGAPITFSATAADSDGTIKMVEFFAGSNLIGTDTQTPYTFDWTSVPSGSHTLTAKATDNGGAVTTSGTVNITVTAQATLYFIHPDHLNTPRVITNQTQQTVWRWENDDPFGANMASENPSGLGNFTFNLRFPGQYFDKETNYYYNYYRDYSPEIGRYVQSDPIGLRGGINTYAYVGGKPIGFVDPQGLAQCTFSMATGRLNCAPNNWNNAPVNIQVASGNNANGMQCRNNPSCTSILNQGPIPLGCWRWTAGSSSKQNGRILEPCPGTSTNVVENRTFIQSHSCQNPFGPGVGPQFCSEGCVTGTDGDIQTLNKLIDSEAGSTLEVLQ